LSKQETYISMMVY